MKQTEPRMESAEAAERCPVCGSSVIGRRYGSGTDVRWCLRCSWSRINDPQGEVERESIPDDAEISLSIRRKIAS